MRCRRRGVKAPLSDLGLRGSGLWVAGIHRYLAHEKQRPPRPYRRLMPRVLGGSSGGGRLLMNDVHLWGEGRGG